MRGQRGESRTWNSSSDWSLNQAVTYTYEDGTNGTLAGRPNGYTSTPTSALWAYDQAGRLSQISNPQNSNSTFTYGYRYTLNSGLHEGITTPGQGTESPMPCTLDGPQVNTTLAYETTRNALAFRRNDRPGGTLSKFAYGLNALGQRVGLTPTGSAFATTTPLSWGYNATGEVTKADSSVNTHDRAYSYDGIGNRLQGSAGVSPAAITTYTPNALNQYTSVSLDTPSTTLNPIHDDDGNMTSGPVPGANGLLPGVPVPANATLTWDAENRLVKAIVNSTTVHYDYDHQSRLISRGVGVTPTTFTRYLYDGWNRIAGYESNGTGHTLKNTYLWGMDMSGSMQGAGGVGGLLSVSQISQSPIPNVSSYYPTYDGNGNVSEYVDENGDKAAHFEYDPFGNLTIDSENNASDFPYRFSTKPQDSITGLYYYGYRYYDPLTGRWLSRDPIEESGGINLYGFVGNDGIGRWDYLGKSPKLKRAWAGDPEKGGPDYDGTHLWVAGWLLADGFNSAQQTGYIIEKFDVTDVKFEKCDGTRISTRYNGTSGDVWTIVPFGPGAKLPSSTSAALPVYTVFVNTSFKMGTTDDAPIENCEKGEVTITWTAYLFFSKDPNERLGDFNSPSNGTVGFDGFENEINHKYYTDTDPIIRGKDAPKSTWAETVQMKVWWNWCDPENRKKRKTENNKKDWPVIQRRWTR